MNDIEEKVRRLIALALNAGATDGESRNAAISALRLIEKHGLLGDPKNEEETAQLVAQIEYLAADNDLLRSQVRGARLHDMMLKQQINDLERKVRDLERRARPPGREPTVTIPTQRAQRQSEWLDGSARGGRRKIMISQYAGRCRRCSEPFEIGDRVAWKAGGGALHVNCYERELEEQGGA